MALTAKPDLPQLDSTIACAIITEGYNPYFLETFCACLTAVFKNVVSSALVADTVSAFAGEVAIKLLVTGIKSDAPSTAAEKPVISFFFINKISSLTDIFIVSGN